MKKDTPLMILLDKFTLFSWSAFNFGIKKCWARKWEEGLLFLAVALFLLGMFWKKYFLYYLHEHFPGFFYPFIWKMLFYLPWKFEFWFFLLSGLTLYVIFLGLKDYITHSKFQKKINKVGIKNLEGQGPRILSVDVIDQNRTKLILNSDAIGINHYEVKKKDLEAAFAQSIESITHGVNEQIVVLQLAKRRLKAIFKFSQGVPMLTKPMTFLLGESVQGPLVKSLESLPHMLIAGTTGGGKSVFFKQTLLGLLKTTEHLQLYLLDLKRGVEMKEFTALPNVRLAKDEAQANFLLQQLKEEMDRRFVYLESNGFKEIQPQRDKMDKIVVGIDEASVLYTRTKSNTATDHIIVKARENTDELAKLARAAGIHLILATQKVTKETIDTKVQENIGGRMSFRMNTLQGSMTVLGNKMAMELPDIKGRAIWSCGNDFIEVQAPYISQEEIEAEIAQVKSDYEEGSKRIFGKMIEVGSFEGGPATSRKNSKSEIKLK